MYGWEEEEEGVSLVFLLFNLHQKRKIYLCERIGQRRRKNSFIAVAPHFTFFHHGIFDGGDPSPGLLLHALPFLFGD